MKDLHTQGFTQNRELSWLKFNQRVLEEGMDETVPLFERFKFISIFTSNLDEFFMIRVGSLFDVLEYNEDAVDNRSGMTPKEQLQAIYKEVSILCKQRELAYFNVAEQLKLHKISRLLYTDLTAAEKKFTKNYFYNAILPILSPQIVDSHHPFPHLSNKTIHIGAMLKINGRELFSVIAVPKALPSLVYLKSTDGIRYIGIEEVIKNYYDDIFSMYEVEDKVIFRVTRNSDINVDDEAFEIENDFRNKMKKLLQRRKHLAAVRLELSNKIGGSFIDFLTEKLALSKKQVFYTKAPLELSYAFSMQDKIPETTRRTLCYAPFKPQKCNRVNLNESLIKQIQKKDLFLSFPFESMDPYLKLIKEASNNKNVLSIKITIYRLASQAKLVEYLCNASENGKDVTVLIELRARFDEQNNIDWSQRLESAGCKVLYGFEGFKVHSKMTLITMREKGVVSYITQVGTGNFNEVTATLYTDFSYITANSVIGREATEFFTNMCIGNLLGSYKNLLVAPINLKNTILNLIDREITKGKDGRILIKINSITDVDIIERLKLASCNNVQIRMIIRGISCLVPHVEGKTENIEIRSIVGRFLEHSRIYCFGKGQDEKLYISSADFMTRNTERRVEVACPIKDKDVVKELHHILNLCFADNLKARTLHSDGNYYKIEDNGGDSLDCQKTLMMEARVNGLNKSTKPESFISKVLKLFYKR